jgi:hypothetical protein
VHADVVQPTGPEQGVAYGMYQDIRVGMAQEPFIVWDFDSAQNEIAAFDQPVKIKTDARSKTRVRHPYLPYPWLLKK